MEFKNLDDLSKYLQSNINDILQNEVAESVKDTMLFAVDRTVYDKYDPLYYVRRGDNGGLADRKNIVVIDEDDTIFVENRTLVNDNIEHLLMIIMVRIMQASFYRQ